MFLKRSKSRKRIAAILPVVRESFNVDFRCLLNMSRLGRLVNASWKAIWTIAFMQKKIDRFSYVC